MRARAALIAIGALGLLLGAAGGARAADERRLLDQAEAAFQAAAQAQGRDDEALAEDLLDEAEERLRSVLEIAPRQAFALGRLGALYNQRGQHTKVRALLEPAVAAGVGAAEVRFQLALALEHTGEPARAVALAEALVAEAPRSPLAQGLLARLLARRGDLPGAASALARRRALAPGTTSDAYDFLQLEADVALRRHRPRDAAIPLEELARTRGAASDVRNLAAVLAATGAADRASALLAGLDARERRKPRTLAVKAYVELAAKRPREALETARQLAQVSGFGARAHVLEGRALADLGRASEARTAFQGALAAAPDDADAHAGLGLVLWQQGAAAAARPHLAIAARALPHRATVCAAHGEALAALGQRAEALTALRACAAAHDDDERPALALGALLSAGEAARPALDEALGVLGTAESRTRSPAVRAALVRLLQRRARIDLLAAMTGAADHRAFAEEALRLLDRAGALAPADERIAADQAIALLLADRAGEAMQRLTPRVERGDAAVVGLYLRAATTAGQAAAALRAGRAARARRPADLRLVAELAAAELAAGQPGAAADTLHDSGRADLVAAEARANVQEVASLLGRNQAEAAYARAARAVRLEVAGAPRDGLDVAFVLAALRAGHRDGLSARAARLADPAADARLAPWVGGASAHLRAVATYLLGRMNDAARAAEQAMTGAQKGEPARLRGLALVALGAQKLDAGAVGPAADALRVASRLLPTDEPAAAALHAALAWRKGDRTTAERLWSLAARDVPEALVGLGLVAAERGQRARAQELYRRYLRSGDDERVRRWLELSQRFTDPRERP